MMSLRAGRIRAFHSYSRLLQNQQPVTSFEEVLKKIQEANEGVKPIDNAMAKLRGKKKAPAKPNLVILNAKQSKLFKKIPKEIQSMPGLHVLDLGEIERSRKRLMKFKSDVSQEHIIQSIHYIKPDTTTVSVVRFRQMEDDMLTAYNATQLKAFIKKNLPNRSLRQSSTKRQMIDIILKEFWGLTQSNEINPVQDLLIQRIFDLSPQEMFVLLAQNSIASWLRANVQVILIPTDGQLIVRASSQHVAYIEMALSRIFENITTDSLNLEQIQKLYQQHDEKLPLDEIQRLSGVYIHSKQLPETTTTNTEPITSTESNDYIMAALGKKKFQLAKRLMIWALNFNPFVKTSIHIDINSPALKWYKSILNETMPWIHKGKTWVRLKKPKNTDSISKPAPIELDHEKIFNELNTSGTPNTSVTGETQSVTAVNFGHLLYDEATLFKPNPKTFFQTTLPHIRQKVFNLQPFISEEEQEFSDELRSADRHEYYAQIKLFPTPFENAENYLKHSPIEFWIEIDEEFKGNVSTLQVLRIINEQNSIVSLPEEPCDLKFLKSESESLIDSFNGSETWLQEQPGIQEFLKNSNLDFSGKPGLRISDHVDIKIPGTEEVVRYNYVSLSYRKHLSMKHKDRLLQYAIVEGGALGGRTSEILLVGKVDDITQDEFKDFVDDSVKFARSLHLKR